MINVDRDDPNVRLVTDRPDSSAAVTKVARDIERLDNIAVAFAGYGKVVAEVIAVHHRDGLVDLTVKAGDLSTTTVRRADAPELTYPNFLIGEWLR
jgi:hypothetical protein